MWLHRELFFRCFDLGNTGKVDSGTDVVIVVAVAEIAAVEQGIVAGNLLKFFGEVVLLNLVDFFGMQRRQFEVSVVDYSPLKAVIDWHFVY